mmetsp:Transcript_40437/g.35892  ORF Transcript_40437/g.35892 Transcript_40437/m.35892 type:complete len:167 (-) Transcript_40437:609-1109(-)
MSTVKIGIHPKVELSGAYKKQLAKAIAEGNVAKVHRYLEVFELKPDSICSTEDKGWSCFHYAIALNRADLVKYFVRRVFISDPNSLPEFLNQKTKKEGLTPIMVALANKNLLMAEELWNIGGVRLTAKDPKGNTIIQYANKFEAIGLLKKLNEWVENKPTVILTTV